MELVIGIIIGIVIGWSLLSALLKREFADNYRRAICEMGMFKKGDSRRQFWHGVENTLALAGVSIMGRERADANWHKLTGEKKR